ncbi:MAG: DUF2332 domain-containing protein [Chloroflexi bacterium]|nr:DUF2332 domain-containing protein [Chloroflexota bacterium]
MRAPPAHLPPAHPPPIMTDFRARLIRRFRKQQEFADGYSPLYARLFGLVGDWLEDGDELAVWLLAVGDGRSTLDITLLLLTGLHRDILNHEPDTAELAQFYPSVGGERPLTDSQLPQILRQTILIRRDALAPFIQTATVQTNATSRGIAWLLPLRYPGWEAIHLVDLGASAGLNLAAEARNYRLVFSNQSAVNGKQYVDFGNGQPIQFTMQSHGNFHLPPATCDLPHILSRTGCDIAPFRLNTAADEQTLAAFIWADQPRRLERLREGIAAFRQASQSRAPIRLHSARLPDDLPRFLCQHIPAQPNAPVVIYNTYMTAYLDDKGASMRQLIADWAATQNRPVLWLQWEPLWEKGQSPSDDLIAWTADLWQGGKHGYWHLAWNHPHGTHIHWQKGLRDWAAFWQTSG